LIAWYVTRGDSLFNIQGNNKQLIRRHKNNFFPEGPQRYRPDKPPVQHFENLGNTRHANIFREGKNRYKLVLIRLGVPNSPPAFQSGLTLEIAKRRAKEFAGAPNE
jgi:hypothetical protein